MDGAVRRQTGKPEAVKEKNWEVHTKIAEEVVTQGTLNNVGMYIL